MTTLSQTLAAIADWDLENVRDLRDMLREGDRLASEDDRRLSDILDMAALPSADIPVDVDTSYPVWAMDAAGRMLVGDRADEIMTIADYRARS